MAKGRRKRDSLLGVEFTDSEIRAVEVRYAGGRPILLGVGSTPMPPNSLVEGELVRAEAVGFALRKLLEHIGSTASEAVLGIPMAGFATRALSLPPSPPDEQAMLIEGEVRHFDILRTPDGAYDYFELATVDDPESSFVLCAAEGPVTSSLKSVADRAGLDVVAIEPVSIAQLRAANATGVSAADGLYLSIGESASEASVIRDGRLWLYRRIDIGVNALFATSRGDQRIDHRLTKEEAEAVEQERSRELRRGPADSLGLEVRRTMEFYAREFTGANPVKVLHLMLNDTLLEQVEPFLRDATGAEIEVVRPGGFIAHSDTGAQELSSPTGYRYTGAYGLALHGHDQSQAIPTLDLFVRERSMAAMEYSRKTLAGSLAASIVAIVIGIGGAFYFGTQANQAQAESKMVQQKIAQLRALQEETIKRDQETMEQIAYLSKQGIPAVSVIDSLASSMDPGVGFNKVILENEASLSLDGEAKSIESLVLTVQRIQSQPGLGMAIVKSYERLTREGNDPAIRFSLRLMRNSAAPVPAQPKPTNQQPTGGTS